MDRGLAQRYGALYVHLAAFAIDVDRVRELDPEDGSLPFGWEVWLLEHYLRFLLEAGDSAPDKTTAVLEDACLSVMDLPRPLPGRPAPFGSQLPFAIYAGVARGRLPESLGSCFRSWRKPPVDLLQELEAMDRTPTTRDALVRHCLGAPVEPALVPPVKAALEALLAFEPDEASAGELSDADDDLG